MKTAQAIEAQSSLTVKAKAEKKRPRPSARSLANLRPFRPGQSGNPGGRPKNDVAQEIAQAIFSNNPELIYQAFSKTLGKGNAYAFQVLSDRAFGKLKETKEVTHRHGDIPDGDLQARIDKLMQDLGLAQAVDAASEIAKDVIKPT